MQQRSNRNGAISKAILASGGLDSSVMLAEQARRGYTIFPLYVCANFKWERAELNALRRFIDALDERAVRPVTVLRMPFDDLARDHWGMTGQGVPGYDAPVESNYIPGRNLSLLAKAAIFCAMNGIGELMLAPLAANPFPDARPEFFAAMKQAVRLGLNYRLQIVAPYVGKSKAALIRRARHLPLELTLSCARPKAGRHCGECTKCAERIEAFREARVPDPTRYANRRSPSLHRNSR